MTINSKTDENNTNDTQPQESVNVQGNNSVNVGGNTFKKIGTELINDMPSVSENAIEQHQEKENEAASLRLNAMKKAAGRKDRHGNSFDPDLHKVDESGEPVLTKKGQLRMKAGAGRPRESRTNRSTLGKTTTQIHQAASVDGDLQTKQQARAAGITAANTFLTLCVAVGGDEWQPVKSTEHGIDEKFLLEEATANYFEATGKTDFPPVMGLVFAVGMYAMPRFTMPKTQKKTRNVFLWIRDKWTARKLKREHAKGLIAKQRQEEAEKKDEAS